MAAAGYARSLHGEADIERARLTDDAVEGRLDHKLPADAASHWVRTFDAIGLGQWFRYATGIVEVAGGLLFLVPAATRMQPSERSAAWPPWRASLPSGYVVPTLGGIP